MDHLAKEFLEFGGVEFLDRTWIVGPKTRQRDLGSDFEANVLVEDAIRGTARGVA
jgi:hypothetical protein